jgi:UDP-N-acetylglucosamine--N-acetylmuramyl-(pentapeptide) pyrophosphoryl-undecaprenol N-acetylglucosamine transferase
MAAKRIVITAGGTGGHLYPAQGLAQQLAQHSSASSVLFVAGGLATNRYFDPQAFAFQEVACSPLLSKHPVKMIRGITNLAKGFWQSRQILKHYQPDILIGFGSYYTVSTLLAAKSLKIPFILHEANSIPGQANQWLAPLAHSVALHFPSTASLIKGNKRCIEVGLPLRVGYQRQLIEKKQALAYFQLEEGRQTWLICGGSQGARAINQLVEKSLPELASQNLQFIHLTGNVQAAEHLKKCYAMHHIPACVKPFEHQMQLAWRAADTFVGRAGASTIAEAIEFEVPGILIPYPFAADQHQEKNADFLVHTVKAGYKHLEKELNPHQFVRAIESLTRSPQLETFQWALHQYKQRPHQTTLCDLIFSIGAI